MADQTKFIAFKCDVCKQELEAPSTMIGSEVACPSCGHKIVVPNENLQTQNLTPEQQEAQKRTTIRIELF